ncbi:hypothetical protein H114_00692 [Streptomyces gancidicus BKS 13-15]|uniref:Uncharacterized protein n=1 Tax=Streptomyces gancidicus BKS 13-15 TaxID=1284664 RepID=M3EDE2_STREZ|nr:hypothetical protein [Streptomyces gancidicus]EMF31101.1 hypothetical protein H114_00692 [Streptomyces gancidicus BKS 13-15]
MPSTNPVDYCRKERHAARGRLAALTRVRPAGDPDIDRARRRLAAIKAQALLLAAGEALKEATNPAAPDMELPLSLCSSAADEVARRLTAAAG